MRIAILSDIHGNLTALEAVLADLHLTAPDLVLHGDDITDPGSSPIEVLDLIASLRWPGVLGNTD
jgi:predicted phosphodiesterase